MFAAGIAGVGVFYAGILGVSIWAATSKKKKIPNKSLDGLIVENRKLGLILGIFTLVATWVGGVFVNGTAEAMFSKGLVWCQVPIGYSFSLLFGAILFVKPMRKADYVTLLDPFQQRYGAQFGSLFFLPALIGDLLWCAAVIKALANTISVITEVDNIISVTAAALLTIIYTTFGGLYMVSGTDALQLVCVMLGLATATPYVILNSPAPLEKKLTQKDWLGEVESQDLAEWIDGLLLLIFGGIPWQGYIQRILMMKTTSTAKIASVASMICCLILAIPPALIGLIARGTDWSVIEDFNRTTPTSSFNNGSILPIILKHFTPQWVAFVGLGTISTTVMSSANSSIFSSSSIFSRNIYRMTIRPKASEKELTWILRITLIFIALLSAGIALVVQSVYYLSFLSSDLVYVVLFPQLLAVLHWPSLVDTYGCLAGYIVSITLRIAGGEKGVGLPPLIYYPFFDHRTQTQKFPIRTTAMILSVITQLIVSFITRKIFDGTTCCPRHCDFLGIYASGKSKEQSSVAQSSSGAALLLIDSVMTEGSAGRDSTDSQEDDRPSYEDSRTSEDTINYSTFGERPDYTLRRGMSVQNTPISRINRTFPKNVTQTPGRNRVQHSHLNNLDGQILGVRNLPTTPLNQVLLSNEINHNNTLKMVPPPVISNTPVTSAYSTYGKFTNIEKAKEIEKNGDRNSLELNLNLNLNLQEAPVGVVKKNVVGVKLVGMDGTTTLRRPSQGTFSPTPSVELVHILDRRQSGSSPFGPPSLSPVPGVEACKIHGTAVGGAGNEHCRIKRGIVRHHSFNETGDRTLTTLARQPTYPSMPLRSEDCRMTLMKKDKKPSETIERHSSVADEKCLIGGRGLVLSPSYSMYGSVVTDHSYFLAEDEAISRF
ncbi:high affinity choline transporter 1-like [Chelonus insularis]|uniref:high affinity choline transporter 1-like n=1 Tax=Chelonus insularis TaxID=460826 RepID=UPI00158A8D0C|nr:high affinity choline transporter 1-like [Chelonus insularis]